MAWKEWLRSDSIRYRFLVNNGYFFIFIHKHYSIFAATKVRSLVLGPCFRDFHRILLLTPHVLPFPFLALSLFVIMKENKKEAHILNFKQMINVWKLASFRRRKQWIPWRKKEGRNCHLLKQRLSVDILSPSSSVAGWAISIIIEALLLIEVLFQGLSRLYQSPRLNAFFPKINFGDLLWDLYFYLSFLWMWIVPIINRFQKEFQATAVLWWQHRHPIVLCDLLAFWDSVMAPLPRPWFLLDATVLGIFWSDRFDPKEHRKAAIWTWFRDLKVKSFKSGAGDYEFLDTVGIWLSLSASLAAHEKRTKTFCAEGHGRWP